MQVLPAELKHGCDLKFSPQTARRNIRRARQRQQIAEIFRQQVGLAVADLFGHQLNHVTPGEVDIL